LPRQYHVYITTDETFFFHKKKFNEMPCKLDSTKNPRLFEKYQITLMKVRKEMVEIEFGGG